MCEENYCIIKYNYRYNLQPTVKIFFFIGEQLTTYNEKLIPRLTIFSL
jgi:hypothetical protein